MSLLICGFVDAKNGGQYALWVSQLNATYTPLYNIDNYTASAKQPDGCVFGDNTAPIFNDTMLVSHSVITYLAKFRTCAGSLPSRTTTHTSPLIIYPL